LYESVTGKLPFESEHQGGLVLREEDTPPEFPSDFPARLRVPVERSLRLSPDDRYADVGELLADIDQTARQGDSVRVAFDDLPQRPSGKASAADRPTPGSSEELRQTAADLARASVEVARGVWEGLRGAKEGEGVPAAVDEAATPRPDPPSETDTLRSVRRAKEKARGVWGDLSDAAGEVTEAARSVSHEVGQAASSVGRESRNAAKALKRAAGRRTSDPDATPPGPPAATPVAATVPVPPRVEGGVVGTMFSTVVVGLEVVVSLVGNLLRGSVRLFKGLGDRSLRASGGFLSRSMRLVAFVLVMMLLGAIVMTVGLLFMDAIGAR